MVIVVHCGYVSATALPLCAVWCTGSSADSGTMVANNRCWMQNACPFKAGSRFGSGHGGLVTWWLLANHVQDRLLGGGADGRLRPLGHNSSTLMGGLGIVIIQTGDWVGNAQSGGCILDEVPQCPQIGFNLQCKCRIQYHITLKCPLLAFPSDREA